MELVVFREDDLKTFEGWLRYQGVDAAKSAPEELDRWQSLFDDVRKRSSAKPKGRADEAPTSPRGTSVCGGGPRRL